MAVRSRLSFSYAQKIWLTLHVKIEGLAVSLLCRVYLHSFVLCVELICTASSVGFSLCLFRFVHPSLPGFGEQLSSS